MKKLACLFVCLFAVAMSHAQNLTSVTGLVTDGDGQVWSSATWRADIQMPYGGQAHYKTGGTVPARFTGVLTTTGTFSNALVANTNAIVPAGVTWKFTVCSLTSAACQVFAPISVSGTSQNVGAYISSNATAPRIQSEKLVYAYNSTEILNPVNGNGYLNTVSSSLYIWNGGTWVAAGGGSFTPPGSPTQVIINNGATADASLATMDHQGNQMIPSTGSFNNFGTSHNTAGVDWWNTSPIYSRTDGTFSLLPGFNHEVQDYPTHHSSNCQNKYPGWNMGNVGPFDARWFIFSCEQLNAYTGHAGIFNVFSSSSQHTGGGDSNIQNHYYSGRPGWIAASDEGVVGLRLSWTSMDNNPMIMTLQSATGSAPTTVSGNCSNNCGSVGAQSNVLVDTQTSVAANISNITILNPNTPIALAQATITGQTYAQSVCGTVTANIGTPTQPINLQSTPQTFTLNLTTPGQFTANSLMTGAGPYWENTAVTSVSAPSGGSQTITASLVYPYLAGATFCSGGAAGLYSEQTAYTAASGGTINLFTVVGSNATNQLLIMSSEQGNSTATFVNTGGINLYQGSTVVDPGNSCTHTNINSLRPDDPCLFVGNAGTLTFGVMPSPFPWNVGHVYKIYDTPQETTESIKTFHHDTNPVAYKVGFHHGFDHNTINGNLGLVLDAPLVPTNLITQGTNPSNILVGGAGAYLTGTWGVGMLLNSYPEGFRLPGTPSLFPPALMAIAGNNGFAAGSSNTFFDLFQDQNPNPGYGYHFMRYTPMGGIMDNTSFATWRFANTDSQTSYAPKVRLSTLALNYGGTLLGYGSNALFGWYNNGGTTVYGQPTGTYKYKLCTNSDGVLSTTLMTTESGTCPFQNIMDGAHGINGYMELLANGNNTAPNAAVGIGANGTGPTNLEPWITDGQGNTLLRSLRIWPLTNPGCLQNDGSGNVTSGTCGSSARVCNANGCYVRNSDGTTTQWGTVAGIASGGSSAVTFPIAFTSTANLTVTTSCNNGAGNCLTGSSNKTTAGFTFQQNAVIFIGGGGSVLSGGQNGEWIAVGY